MASRPPQSPSAASLSRAKGKPPQRGSRRRALTILVALAGVAAVAVLLRASLVRIGPGERAFRVPAAGGAISHLPPGRHLVVPLLHRLIRMPAGPVEVAGDAEVQSREGVALVVPYTIEAEIDDAPLAALLRAAGGGRGPDDVLRGTASATLSDWAGSRSGEAIVLREGEAALLATLRERLQGRGFEAVTAGLGAVRGPADLLASIQGRALRERMADTRTRVAILGLDGADWEIIDPLIAHGRLPNLARLKARGAWGNMKSMEPMLSPLLWTSVATGKPPEEHGIIDFLVQDAKTGQPVPVSSRWRKVKALWNIFTDAGKSSAFIAWWGTWPAEAVQGHMVSDRVAYSLFGYKAAEGDRAGATHPPEYFKAMRSRIVDDSAISLSDVQEFARVTPAEFAALRARLKDDPKLGYREPVNHLTKILAGARTYQAIGLDILGRGQPDLFSLYYQGIDEVCHRFAHYMPPKMAMVTDEEYRKYRDAVEAYYRYQDRLLGEVLARLSPDTTVIVMSDHGFRNGSGRPPNDPPFIEGKPGLWHRRYGIFVIAGPPVRPGRLDTTALLDVAPTVLYLSGLPIAADMRGRLIEEAIDPAFRARFPVRTVPSYESIGTPLDTGRDLVADSGVDQEMIEQLRSLGYVGGQTAPAGGPEAGPGHAGQGQAGPGGPESLAGRRPDGQALVTGHLNEGTLYLKKNDYRRAEAAVDLALKAAPDFVPALLLSAQIQTEQKHYDPAIQALRRVIALDPEGERQVYTQIGRLFSDGGRAAEGLLELRRLARDHPGLGEARAAIGAMLLKRGETEAAEKELLEALRINPALSEPLTELHTIYGESERMLGLEPIVRKGLGINEQSVVHHNWMGLIYEWKKQVPEAEREFLRAMELDPDYAATMANLGALYGRTGRLPEAAEVLTRAVAKEPDNTEAWVNLGAAQGRLGRAREAIEALETARRKGVRTTTLYNALALAYLQDRQKAKALEYLKESLAIDPGQKDAQDLLKAVTRSS